MPGVQDKRRDLALKKFSAKSIFLQLAQATKQTGLVTIFNRGRPCEVLKEKLIAYVIDARLLGKVYEIMEQEKKDINAWVTERRVPPDMVH